MNELVYNEATDTIRQSPQNYHIAHKQAGYWVCDPDPAADKHLVLKLFNEIFENHDSKWGTALNLLNKLKDQEVIDEVESILEGAGWCTDQYIRNFSPLDDAKQFAVMKELAKRKLLFDEEVISEYGGESKPKKGCMTPEQVEKEYGYLIK